MTDIVERLRDPRFSGFARDGIASEAANEIERLRDHIKFLNSFRPDAELARLRGLLREGLGEHVRLHVHPHFPAWEKRVREALGDD